MKMAVSYVYKHMNFANIRFICFENKKSQTYEMAVSYVCKHMNFANI